MMLEQLGNSLLSPVPRPADESCKGHFSPTELLHMVDAPWLLQENCINGQLQALSNISTFTPVSPRLWSSVCVHHVPEP